MADVRVPVLTTGTHPLTGVDGGAPGPAVLISAGEASGDHHAASLMRAVQSLREGATPIRFFGLGGQAMAAAGLDRVARSEEVTVVGIVEVFRHLPRIRRVFRRLLDAAEARGPALAVLVDFPDFNLRLARRLKRLGVPVLYYVSPQVWAWRRRRVRTIARLVDRMLVLFPFEVEVYRGRQLEVEHVGHPLVDDVPRIESVWEGESRQPERPMFALLPGSRNGEVRRILPSMLESVARLAQSGVGGGRLAARIILAPTVDEQLVAGLVAASSLAGSPPELVTRDRFEAIAGAHLALCASGTATLEVGLLGTPMVVVYRVSSLTYAIGRCLVDLPFISLVNLVLERRVVPELLQRDASAGGIAVQAAELLGDRERIDRMREELSRLRPTLGRSGASERAARSLLDQLTATRTVKEGGRSCGA